MKKIVAFDFDGTLTRKDTLIEFIRFAKGSAALFVGLLLLSPWLVAFKLKLYPNWRAKERLFACFFKGMKQAGFNMLCNEFFRIKGESLLYRSAIRQIRKYTEEGREIVIVSASIENWVCPFGEYLGANKVIGTKIETDDNERLTGRFLTANCYGREKVARLQAELPPRNTYYLTAYGDSRGDKELLDFADERYYKYFKE